jgi:serine/threonine protein kinase
MTIAQKLGRYLLVDEIASGGMATVYRGKLLGIEGFEKDVAVKKILPVWSHNREFVTMLIDEAKVLVPLQHNNIVQVFELGKDGEAYFLVMEYVDGFDLRALLSRLKVKKRRLPLTLACYIMQQICLGLDFAHTRKNNTGKALQLVHRDISPQNILLSREGNVKITDFGIAKAIGRTTETATGILKGKFSYMSPEQALGQNIDHRSDIFALGALFYEMIFGEKCFEGHNDLEILEKVKHAKVLFTDDTLSSLVSIISKALAREPANRYQSAADLLTDITAFEHEQTLRATGMDLKFFLAEFFTEHKPDTHSALPEAHTVLQNSDPDQTPTRLDTRQLPRTVIEDRTHIDERVTRLMSEPPKPLPKKKQPEKNKKWPLALAFGLLSLLITGGLFWLNSPQTLPEKPSPKAPTPTKLTEPELTITLPIQRQEDQTALIKNPPPPATLEASYIVSVNPAEAKLTTIINGKALTIKNSEPMSFAFLGESTSLNVTASLKGYKSQSAKLKFDKDHLQTQLTLNLEKLRFGTVRVNAIPWGKATVSGGGSGSTPTSFRVSVGKQTLRVSQGKGTKSLSTSLTVEENSTVVCTARFADNRLTCQ